MCMRSEVFSAKASDIQAVCLCKLLGREPRHQFLHHPLTTAQAAVVSSYQPNNKIININYYESQYCNSSDATKLPILLTDFHKCFTKLLFKNKFYEIKQLISISFTYVKQYDKIVYTKLTLITAQLFMGK